MKRLTEREKTILNLMKDGFENNKIAEMIYVSKHTVKAHISSIIKKLEAKNRTNAVYIAAKQEFSK
ncbi:MAG: LuxR C-terminal-related transcriptional regulator [Candidatus Gastranaerophilales bacterium]